MTTTINAKTKKEIEEMMEHCKYLTVEQCRTAIEEIATEKYCPNIKDNCLGNGCAFFVIDRPNVDKHYLEGKCTFAGSRPLAGIYGTQSDIMDEETMQ